MIVTLFMLPRRRGRHHRHGESVTPSYTMGGRKKIKFGEPVEVTLSLRERERVLEHTFADPELVDRLKIARTAGPKVIARYNLDDLDALLGYVAAEANHSKDKKLQKELYALFERLQTIMESYDEEPEG